MHNRVWLALVTAMLLAGCSPSPTPPASRTTDSTPPRTTETSAGTSVQADDPSLPRADDAGNYPAEVLLAYIRARNRSDLKTAYSLTAPPKGDYASWTDSWSEDAVPWDDFTTHETRIIEPNRALVRVTYSTIGFSALEGVPPEDSRRLVVIREPGEWWVLEKHDGLWKVTFKGPRD